MAMVSRIIPWFMSDGVTSGISSLTVITWKQSDDVTYVLLLTLKVAMGRGELV